MRTVASSRVESDICGGGRNAAMARAHAASSCLVISQGF
jgi:hypothetical protein